jgi:hypothetical protein
MSTPGQAGARARLSAIGRLGWPDDVRTLALFGTQRCSNPDHSEEQNHPLGVKSGQYLGLDKGEDGAGCPTAAANPPAKEGRVELGFAWS